MSGDNRTHFVGDTCQGGHVKESENLKHIQSDKELREQLLELIEEGVIEIEKKGTVTINGKDFAELEIHWLKGPLADG